MDDVRANPAAYGFVVNVRSNADGVEPTPIGFAFHEDTVAAQPALLFYRYLASIFEVQETTFTYGDFAAIMVTRGWLYDGEEGMLLAPEGFGMQQPFPYNSAGLPLTASVDRAAQNGWREYMRQTYRWNVFSSKREGEEHNGQPTYIVYVL